MDTILLSFAQKATRMNIGSTTLRRFQRSGIRPEFEYELDQLTRKDRPESGFDQSEALALSATRSEGPVVISEDERWLWIRALLPNIRWQRSVTELNLYFVMMLVGLRRFNGEYLQHSSFGNLGWAEVTRIVYSVALQSIFECDAIQPLGCVRRHGDTEGEQTLRSISSILLSSRQTGGDELKYQDDNIIL
nr:hypothetical protein Iba_chr09bCG3220 [Ipomoea batatas]